VNFNWVLTFDANVIDSGRTYVAAGGQISASISANVTFNDTNQHRVDLIVDTGNEVPESNENNNSKTEYITATQGGYG